MSHAEKKLKEELSLSKMESKLFQKLLEAIYRNFDITEILNILAEGIQKILQFNIVLISLYNKEKNVLERMAQAGIPEDAFSRLKKQKVPFNKIKILLRSEFKLGNSYYVPHSQFEKSKRFKDYVEKYGIKVGARKIPKKGKWHPDDVFITPIRTSDRKFLGIVSVDDPVNKKVPSAKTISLMETFSTYASIAIENVLTMRQEKDAIKRLSSILNISKIIGQIFDLNTLYRETIHIIRERFGYSNIAIFEVNSKGKPILKSFSGYSDVDIKKVTKDMKHKGLTGLAIQTKKPLLISNVQDDPRYIGDNTRPKSEAVIPLLIKNRIVGVLDVEMEKKNSLGEKDLSALTLLGEYIAMSINNAHLYRETQRLAIRDEMTGMYNYRYFKDVLKKKIQSKEKRAEQLSLLMVDIDNFKKLNDTLGHIIGDKVLKRVSMVIKKNVRKMDTVTRYGGDEFVIILWGVRKEPAKLLGERIRKAVKLELKEFNFPLTISIGICSFPEDGKKVGVLLDKVDKALYRAKAQGRDRISA
ncbi:MAG: GGDEF domain-containing protein [Candidatus Cloacimonadota bacterium]|nr:MAG: GGDEF domain-containing protein [Candidatus Cloacimonadota bacterium]